MRELLKEFQDENSEINQIMSYFEEINQYYRSSLQAMGMLKREDRFSIVSSAEGNQRFIFSEVSTSNNKYTIGDKK
ncbi:MAG TPA: hypothetical protein DCX03_00270 [Bacteroidales bacterium]|nr:hypothetical protein [Bacteroidales bacterium]